MMSSPISNSLFLTPYYLAKSIGKKWPKSSYALVVEFTLINDDKIFAKDYLFFMDGSRKYAFHFQDNRGRLIFRFDNALHWKNIATFPFHKHLPNKVTESKIMNLEKVLSEIEHYLKGSYYEN